MTLETARRLLPILVVVAAAGGILLGIAIFDAID